MRSSARNSANLSVFFFCVVRRTGTHASFLSAVFMSLSSFFLGGVWSLGVVVHPYRAVVVPVRVSVGDVGVYPTMPKARRYSPMREIHIWIADMVDPANIVI